MKGAGLKPNIHPPTYLLGLATPAPKPFSNFYQYLFLYNFIMIGGMII